MFLNKTADKIVFKFLNNVNYGYLELTTVDGKILKFGNSEEKLKAAFKLFDKDDGGTISATEIKSILTGSGPIEEKIWQEVLQEVDEDGNGTIEYNEFKIMM